MRGCLGQCGSVSLQAPVVVPGPMNVGVEPPNHSVVGMCMVYECVCIGAGVGCSVCNSVLVV